MKTCNDCKDKEICKKPCGWLKEKLDEVTICKQYLTFTELGIDERNVEDLEHLIVRRNIRGSRKQSINYNNNWELNGQE